MKKIFARPKYSDFFGIYSYHLFCGLFFTDDFGNSVKLTIDGVRSLFGFRI